MQPQIPNSDDKEFWGDAQVTTATPEVLKMAATHVWKQQGHAAICTSCPTEHGLYLAPNQEVKNGQIVTTLSNASRERSSSEDEHPASEYTK